MGYVSGQARDSGGVPFAPGGGGGGGITQITSADSSIVVTNPMGPTVDISATAASVGAVDITGDTMTGPLSMDGNNLVMAGGSILTIDTAAATGSFSGAHIGTTNGVTINGAGSTTAWLNEAGAYSSPTAANVGALPTAGGTMTGDIDMGGFSVVNVTLDKATTAISTTTAAMGLAHDYEATAAPITITVSTVDFVEGREFLFRARTTSATGGTPVTIATEGGQLIDGALSVVLAFDWDNRTFLVRSGNLVST